jgi:hypothetical protein
MNGHGPSPKGGPISPYPLTGAGAAVTWYPMKYHHRIVGIVNLIRGKRGGEPKKVLRPKDYIVAAIGVGRTGCVTSSRGSRSRVSERRSISPTGL